MKLPAKFPPGTEVTCNVRGRVFRARVIERVPEGVRIDPPRGITWHVVKATQVTAIHDTRWDPERSQFRGPR